MALPFESNPESSNHEGCSRKYGDPLPARSENKAQMNNRCFVRMIRIQTGVRSQAIKDAIQRTFHSFQRTGRQPQNVLDFDFIMFHDFFPNKELLSSRFKRA